jgi:hypothetical protein
VLCTSVLLGFVYCRAAAYMTPTINGSPTDGLRAIAANPATIEQFIGFVLWQLMRHEQIIREVFSTSLSGRMSGWVESRMGAVAWGPLAIAPFPIPAH